MIWNQHSELAGKHAFLSPSNSAWKNYDDEKLISRFESSSAKYRGTEIHEHAAMDILFGEKYGVKRPSSRTTYNMYVNDAIGYRMRPEQILYYSPFAFGTADAISFRRKLLRIHDLKTGVTPAKMDQLLNYAALFCLEYRYDPTELKFNLRIYQNNEIFEVEPTGDEVQASMDDYVHRSMVLEEYQATHLFDFEV